VTGANEVQTLTITGTANSTFTLNFNGTPATGTLAFTGTTPPTAGNVLNHLNTIPALSGKVGVTGNATGLFTIAYLDSVGGTDISNTALTRTQVTGTTTVSPAPATNGGAPLTLTFLNSLANTQ